MQKKNDNLLDKLVKKNYNNELEEVLEKKYFDENAKNLLLSILYKIEAAYKDYEKVKQNVETKDEFIQNLINNIQKNCDEIKLIKPNSEESEALLKNHTFLVERAKKRIICYPIERKLLYCIAKISKKDTIIKEDYFLIYKTLSDLINVGNNISMVEPMRDFNGYSWTTIATEMESITHNLVYQNLRILLGYKFLNNWINNKEYIIDYIEMMKNRLEENYGAEQEEAFVEELIQLSILLDIKLDRKIKEKIKKIKESVEEKLAKIQDNESFIEEATKTKRELTKEIKHIDETMNNKELLQKEYEKRNENLELEEKIFSIRILSKMMAEEREEKINKIEQLNKLMIPQNFVEYKNTLEEKEKYLKLLEIKDYDKAIEKLLIDMQRTFLQCYLKKLEKIQTKQEITQAIYEYRYYCMLPFDINHTIWQMKPIEKEVEKVAKTLIKKAHELKVINSLAKDEELDYMLLKNIFTTRIINLEEVNIKLNKEKDKYFLQLFDDNAVEEKVEINMQGAIDKKVLEIKLNRKTKVFN